MKIIQKLKIWKELKRLEVRVRQTPSPSTFVDLGQVYINLGMHEQTLHLADEGLALFPNSNELRKLRRFAKKTQLTRRVKDLKAQLARSAQPGLYRELAHLYLELGDFDAVNGTCEECIRRFPDDEKAYLVLARAHLARFYRDLVASDGLEAVRNLETAVALDSRNVKAHKLLAEVLYRIGAQGRALHHLRILRGMGLDDSEVEAMYQKTSDADEDADEELETLFHSVEANGRLACAPLVRERRSAENTGDPALVGVRGLLAQIAESDGVRKAAYIRGGRALVKGNIRDGKDSFLRVTRVVAKAAQRASRRMDIGNFNRGIVDCDVGQICLCSFGDALAAVFCDRGAASEQILDDLQDLVAGSLYTASEGDR